MIAVFDNCNYLHQFRGGADIATSKEITPQQWENIRQLKLVLWNDEACPRYIFDGSDSEGVPLANGYIRKTTEAEKLDFPPYIKRKEKEAADAAQNEAKESWQDLPDWVRTFSDVQINTYVDDNITDLASARTAFKSIAKTLRKLIDLQKINYGG